MYPPLTRAPEKIGTGRNNEEARRGWGEAERGMRWWIPAIGHRESTWDFFSPGRRWERREGMDGGHPVCEADRG